MSIKKALTAVALTAPLLFGAGQAAAGEVFCVDSKPYDPFPLLSGNQTACSGAGAQSGSTGFQADLLNGLYSEKVLVVAGGPTGLSFSATIVANWNAFALGGEAVESTGLDSDNGYNLYAVVTASGVITGANSFTATSATLKFFLDADQDAALGLNSIDSTTLIHTAGGVADILLGESNILLSGSGTTSASAGTDGFAVTFGEFALTPAGESFFIAPRPFYLQAYSDGDINDGQAEQIQPGLLSIRGDLSAEFQKVPEPGSLALVGLALAGLGFASRRRSV